MIIAGTTYEGKLLNVFIKDVLHQCCRDFWVHDDYLECRYRAWGPDTWMLRRTLADIAERYGVEGEIITRDAGKYKHYLLRLPRALLDQFPPQPFVPPAPQPAVAYTVIEGDLPF